MEDKTKNEPVLSILVITYQHEKYIHKCLESIFMQKVTFRYELIIADDYSTDGTRNVIKEYKKSYKNQIKLVLQRKNVGATKNIYCAYKLAKGKYIIAVEGDDYWTDPYKLQKQVDYLEENKHYLGVFHKCKFVDENDHIVKKAYNELYYSKNGYSLKDFQKGTLPGHTATFMFRRDKVDYEAVYKLHNMVGDQTVYAILLAQGNFGYIDEEMSAYRIVIKKDGTNACSIASANNFAYVMWRYYNNLENYIKENYHVDIDLRVQKEREYNSAVYRLKNNPTFTNFVVWIKVFMYRKEKKNFKIYEYINR